MPEENKGVSKFMNSMMNADGIGSQGDSVGGKIPVDNDEKVSNCFSYISKIQKFYLFAPIVFLMIYINMYLQNQSNYSNLYCESIALLVTLIFLCCPVFYGYVYLFIRSLTQQQGEYELPKFKFWRSVLIYIKLNVALVLFVLPPTILAFSFPVFDKIFPPLVLLFGFLLLVYGVVFLYCFPACTWLFANTEDLLSFVNFKKILMLIGKNKSRYMDAIGLSILMFILVVVGTFILMNPNLIHIPGSFSKIILRINKILPIFLTSLLHTYAMFVFCYICAKSINKKELINLSNREELTQ